MTTLLQALLQRPTRNWHAPVADNAVDHEQIARGIVVDEVELQTLAKLELTDAQCDAIYHALDVWASDVDPYEFGLPTIAGGGAASGRSIIRGALHGD